MVTSIGGLSSGIDTTSLINSLIQVESQPQTSLKSRVSDVTTANTAYQTVNTKMKSLLTAAQDLIKPDTWKAAKATSTSTDVTVTAAAGAQTGDMTFKIDKLATAHRTTSRFVDASSPVAPSGSFDITVGTQTEPIVLDPDKNTPQGAADAINKVASKTGLPVRASVITTSDGPVLQIASTKTGGENAFAITGLYEEPQIMNQGSDAELIVGDPDFGGFRVTNASNTFTGVMPGVTITATKAPADTTVSVVSDTDAMAAKMQALVDAANGALAQINLSSAAGTASASGAASSGGPLAGDYTVRQLSSKILSSVSSGADKDVVGLETFGSFKKLGIELTREGKLTFNKDTFVSAYNGDPAKIQTAVTEGLAKTMEDVAKAATDSISGSLTTKIKSNATMLTRLNKEILDWDTKLADRRTALQRQFTAMETALAKVSSQSSWLSSQMSSSSSSSE
ncbi:flagellar filament capping protein FliD [Cryptosporangium aurantiacum]|uniref:Flagellar hook-associated protein 2 n=1 Tax=Cryptosporangium aurantiacum TaxID=134849 RepID=A0A1M7R7G1_9ACTN|nr:flagellar filament capping protein FliD [Cryptosporangium aurantiacum]SHN41998.1 flagellar hook-associated protein 2 [Cryptosporangium aurantiacum]